MNLSDQFVLANSTRSFVKPVVLAAALILPAAAIADSATQVVRPGADASVEQHYGRDSVYAPAPGFVPIVATDPQAYGRAGGYVGSEQIQVVESSADASAGQPDVVKAREAQISMPAAQHPEDVRPQASSQPGASQPSPAVLSAAYSGRASGARFDNPESAHGQHEAPAQPLY